MNQNSIIGLFIIPIISLVVTIFILIYFKKSITQLNVRNNSELNESIMRHQLKGLQVIQQSIQSNMTDIRSQVFAALTNSAENTNKRLQEISSQVEKRLDAGFEKTTTIFTDVIKRLALIDEAQKKITELSSSVVDLQAVFTDKRSRGAFGEVQLSGLINNIIPEKHFALQHTLSNGKRADCVLFLPKPSGNIVIDAKFPLENYQRIVDLHLSKDDRRAAAQQFKLDIRKHIQDIANKYILPGETSDGAMMFIPAEAVFAEIHAHYPDLVELSHKIHVWIVSPTTMMAILTTARAVLKDAATRKQVHLIQEHLALLGKDFARFQRRMDDLSRHISQAHLDVEQVHKSSQKISSRFNRIEKVELEQREIVAE